MEQYPLIYSLEEQHERYLFAKFLNNYFKICLAHEVTFTEDPSSEDLLNMYKMIFPSDVLTIDIVKQLLVQGGYLNDKNELLLHLREEMFSTLPAKVRELILEYIPFSQRLLLRQKMNGGNPQESVSGVILDLSARDFFDTQLFTKKNFKFFEAIPKGKRKVGTMYLFQYYQQWCFNVGYVPITPRRLIKCLAELGYKTTKGYFRGITGVTVIPNVCIPTTEEEYNKSLNTCGNIGVLEVGGKLVFNDGQCLSDFNTVTTLNQYIMIRSTWLHGQREKETKVQTEQDILRAEIQIPEQNVSRRQKEILAGRSAGEKQAEASSQLEQSKEITVPEDAHPQRTSDGYAIRAEESRAGDPFMQDDTAERHYDDESDLQCFDSEIGRDNAIDEGAECGIEDRPSGSSEEPEVEPEVDPDEEDIAESEINVSDYRVLFANMRIEYRLYKNSWDFTRFVSLLPPGTQKETTERKQKLFEEFMKTVKTN